MKASNLMSVLARSEDDVVIEQRVDYLNKSIASAQRAITSFHSIGAGALTPYVGAISNGIPANNMDDSSNSLSVANMQLIMENMSELKDLLDVLGM